MNSYLLFVTVLIAFFSLFLVLYLLYKIKELGKEVKKIKNQKSVFPIPQEYDENEQYNRDLAKDYYGDTE